MKISTVARHVREGSKNVIRNGWMTFASISAISISLFILGVFLLLAVNVNYLAQQMENQVEISVYLDVSTTNDVRESLQNSISAMPEVSKVTFVTKAEGLKMMREKMGEDGKDYLEGMDGENNPLPDAFTVEVIQPRDVAKVSEQISDLNNGRVTKPITRVNYGKETVEMLFKVTNIVRIVGIVFVVGLALTALFMIANTIKLTIMARNREIKIMKLVGATNGFIRWPFFVEGSLLGLIGSFIPLGIILGGYWKLLDWIESSGNATFVQFEPLQEISPWLSVALLGIGLAIGIWGSMISVRKYLRV